MKHLGIYIYSSRWLKSFSASWLKLCKARPNHYSHIRAYIYTEINAYPSICLIDIHIFSYLPRLINVHFFFFFFYVCPKKKIYWIGPHTTLTNQPNVPSHQVFELFIYLIQILYEIEQRYDLVFCKRFC